MKDLQRCARGCWVDLSGLILCMKINLCLGSLHLGLGDVSNGGWGGGDGGW
jgi:hypothetical protein